MTQAKKGDQISIHYTGKLSDGTVFDSSVDSKPLAFTLGEGELIEGFEEAVYGMAEGERKSVNIPPEKAYGDRNEEMVVDVPRSQFPDDIDPEIGQQLQIQNEEKEEMLVYISKVTDDIVTLDANPPLAGEDLTFELELVSIA
jgi:peptidylprolyl isomerase